MTRILRLVKYVCYPFLGLSILLLLGMSFGAAFVVDFTIENRTDATVVVTPVGTVGPAGNRAPLPTMLVAFPALPALRNGGYRLAPGQAVTVQYDMDDINFSEIVVEDESGQTLQLVVDANPTSNQYHGPLQRHFIIDDLAQLGPVSAPVQAAAQAANRQWLFACAFYAILVGPWLICGFFTWLLGCWERREASSSSPHATAVAAEL